MELPVLLAAVGLVLLLLYFLLGRKSAQRGDGVMLLGPSGAGKTALFYSLALGGEVRFLDPSSSWNEDGQEKWPLREWGVGWREGRHI
jgi:hypothetical protein